MTVGERIQARREKLGLSDADIMATGGWKTDHVMKSVYRKAMRTEEAMQAFGDSMTTL